MTMQLCELEEHKHCVCISTCNMLTLLTNIFHSSNELLLKVLAVFGDLLTLFQKVLSCLLNRHCQNMSLLGASLLLTGWPFVAGVDQGSHLGQRRGHFSCLCFANSYSVVLALDVMEQCHCGGPPLILRATKIIRLHFNLKITY